MTGLSPTRARRGYFALVCALAFVAACGAASRPAAADAAAGTAAVAAPDRFGTDTAARILGAGGNVADAAVAVAFTLAVTLPEAGNLGGGGFATLWIDGKGYFLDYRECAPASATAGMYLDADGNVVPDASTVGAGAAAVPGTVAGLWELHRRFGRLPWRVDLAPAIRYAHQGFRVSPLLVALRDTRAHELHGRTNFLDYFGKLAPEATFRQAELERTLRAIAADGPRGFYAGHTAGLIVAEMARGHGYVTAADLAAYRPVWREPLEGDWAGYRVITAPPPSSGGIALLSLLAMKADLAGAFAGLPLNSAQYVHLLAELEKRVFADRAVSLGDPDFSPAPVAQLLDPAYLARRAQEVSITAPTPTAAVQPGLGPASGVHHDTTHFSIVDRAGNAVSNTYTLNDSFGSGQVVRGAGFLLNNEMDDFSAKPGAANIYGVVGAEANAIAPGKRPLSTMTPTILLDHERVALVIGTPGGSRIATWVFQVITDWHDFHLPLAAAVAAPRIHHQLLPPNTLFEEPYATLDPAVRAALEQRGYVFVNQGWNGDIEAIAADASGTVAVPDPRGRGRARVLHQARRRRLSGS
ncbi:MAG TPA: gamma-glutamyltransferase [Steroidobacteraceae bacterium]|nr:gamma-glutamyltransferase [Steroidobacteraceae bacterium]